MAIVAKMAATQVVASGGGRWVPCSPNDDGAIPKGDPKSPTQNLYTDSPSWLESAEFVRWESNCQSSESIQLVAVSTPAKSDPDRTNAQWALASPSGELKMLIHNPHAWGYIQPGKEYRITIQAVREKSE